MLRDSDKEKLIIVGDNKCVIYGTLLIVASLDVFCVSVFIFVLNTFTNIAHFCKCNGKGK